MIRRLVGNEAIGTILIAGLSLAQLLFEQIFHLEHEIVLQPGLFCIG